MAASEIIVSLGRKDVEVTLDQFDFYCLPESNRVRVALEMALAAPALSDTEGSA